MNKKFRIFLTYMFILSLIVSGCNSLSKNDTPTANQSAAELNEKNISLEKELSRLERNLEMLNSKLNEQVNIITEIKDNGNLAAESLLPVYTANVDSYKREIDSYIKIPENKNIEEKLSIISKKLSQLHFNNLPIEVVKIENSNGKRIATIDLKETEENKGIKDYSQHKGISWALNYFQGSCCGTETSICLIETFLQKEYKGEWIDGVEFLYNGGKCDFEHVYELSKVNYRK